MEEFHLYFAAKTMHTQPWVLDTDLPRGGLYWVSRSNVFESVAPEIGEHFARLSPKK